jgi:hypothetical protein
MIRRALLFLAVIATIGATACAQLAVAAATVDGHKITDSDVEAELDVLTGDPLFGATLRADPEEFGQTRRQILSQLIYEVITTREAEARDIHPTQAQADRLLSQAAAQQGVSVAELLENEGLTPEQARVLAERNIRRFELMEAIFDEPAIDEDLVDEIYEAQQFQFEGVDPSDAEEEIRQALRQQQLETLYQEWLTDLVREADIVVNPKYGRFETALARPAVVAHDASPQE